MSAALLRARAALVAGRPVEARSEAAEASRRSRSAEACFLLGVSEAMLGNIGEGVTRLREAIALGRSAEYYAQLARYLLLLRQDGEALAALLEARACLAAGENADALTHDTIGCAYARLGKHVDSVPHFQAAMRARPSHAQFRYNYAVALSFVGKVSESEDTFEALLAREPGNARAHHGLAGLRRQTAERNHIPRLRAAQASARDPEARLLLGYTLAKELEDIGEEQEAFRWLLEANAEHRRRMDYDFSRDAAIFDAIEACWPVFSAAPMRDSPVDQPIFIIGMPRTGTTLVDRILSSHPDIVAGGELQAFPIAVKAEAQTRTRTVLDPETLRRAADRDLGAIGRSYMERALAHVPAEAARFSDKFPGNFLYAGLIARALPRASIVCLRRHPMDTVVSNFKNLFATTSSYYNYSYTLEEIAEYYVRFDRLMRFWQRVVPGRILEIDYEDLVEDQEGATRRLLEHCGLQWSERCLKFHDNAAPVSTPSAAQVRRPIYRDALGRWRRYESALEPARRIFEREGIAI